MTTGAWEFMLASGAVAGEPRDRGLGGPAPHWHLQCRTFFIALYRIPCSACRRTLPCFAVNLLRLDCRRTCSHPTGRGLSACVPAVPAANAFGSVQTRARPASRGRARRVSFRLEQTCWQTAAAHVQGLAACIEAGAGLALRRMRGLTAAGHNGDDRRKEAPDMRDIHPATGPRETEHPAKGRRNGSSCAPLPSPRKMLHAGALFPWRIRFPARERCRKN